MTKIHCAEYTQGNVACVFEFVDRCLLELGLTPLSIVHVSTHEGGWYQVWFFADDAEMSSVLAKVDATEGLLAPFWIRDTNYASKPACESKVVDLSTLDRE